jgi:hypothetical protein
VGHDIDIDTPVGTSDILLNNISRWDVGTRARSTGNGGTPGVTAGTATGSGYPILAVDMATGPREWFYVGKDWTVGVSVSRVTPYVLNDSVTFYLERWERPGEITTNTGYNIAMTAVAGNTTMGGTVSPAFTGWYRISKANNDVVPIAGASLGTFYSVVVSCGTMVHAKRPQSGGHLDSNACHASDVVAYHGTSGVCYFFIALGIHQAYCCRYVGDQRHEGS